MKKLIFLLTLLISTTICAQNDVLYVEGLAYKAYTTVQLDALATKVEGDSYYDSDKKRVVTWDGTQWISGGGTVHIDGQSPIDPFDFALGTTTALNALTFDANTVLIPTDNNGDFVTTDGFVTGLTFGLVGSDLTLTAARNGLSNVVSNTIALPSGTPLSYERNSFTPTLIDNGGGATYSASTISGEYTKIEDQVSFTLFFNAISTSGSPSGQLRVNGLPYTGTPDQYSFTVSTFFGGSVPFYSISAELLPGTSTLVFKYQDALDGNMTATLSSTTFTGGSIVISGNYISQ